MTFVALWIPTPPIGAAAGPSAGAAPSGEPPEAALHALLRALLRVTPHALAEPREGGTLVWADGRGLPPRRVAAGVLRAARAALGAAAEGARLGVARVAVAAEVAAQGGAPGGVPVVLVAARHERRFLAERPLSALAQTPSWSRRLAAALADVGLERCGDLAALPLSAVEVRFGAEGAALWRLTRADDPRRVFGPAPRAHPAASVEWSDFAVRDAERLLFFANGLAGRVCADLRARGQVARAMTLRLALAGGGATEHAVRAARASASRAVWLRLLRRLLERVRLPDAACGLALRVDAAHAAEGPQGDLFDAVFQTGAAAEDVVARLVEDGEAAPVRLATSRHPLPERRGVWRAAGPLDAPPAPPAPPAPSADPVAPDAQPLALCVLPAPVRALEAVTYRRRGRAVPAWFRAPGGGRVEVVVAAGPDRVVGGGGEAPADREYWQCATNDGRLVLLYRDAADGAWYVQGEWG